MFVCLRISEISASDSSLAVTTPVSYTHLDVYKRQVYDIPMAINKATADFMLNSSLMSDTYDHEAVSYTHLDVYKRQAL